nr:2-C-methyl-D-erythritol 4-phosphate cytidylyltransferase [uncultured Desulfuromonas sp.]
MSVIVLIPAAGLGRRMGTSVHKQYLCLQGRPVLAHTLSAFQEHPCVDHIYVIAPADQVGFCRQDIIEPGGFTKVRDVIAGGQERQDSVRLGLEACRADDNDIVLIHDGVRPLFDGDLLDGVLKAVDVSGRCVVGVPVKDTIKEVDNGFVVATPERKRLWAAQTPQAFRYHEIMTAHRLAYEQNYTGTDDASLLEWQGKPVAVVEGSYRNIKITTPEDLLVAEAFLANDERRNK